MRGFLAVLRKELRTYFFSPVAWIFAAGLLALVGLFYAFTIEYYIRQYVFSQDQAMGAGGFDVNELLRDGTFQNLIIFMILMVPLLTMRLIAAEKKAKTDELLFTSPISIWAVVLGKFAAALSVLALTLATTIYVPLVTDGIGAIDWAPIWMTYGGLLALGGCFIAAGVFASSLTEEQIIAAVISFVLLLGMLVLSVMGSLFDTPWIKDAVEFMGHQQHFDRLSKGVLDTRDIIYFVSFAGLFLYFSYRYLSARQWQTQGATFRPSYKWIALALGLVLVFSYFLIRKFLPASDVDPRTWQEGIWVVGVLLIAGYAAWDWDKLSERLSSRSFQFSSLASAEALVVVALVLGGNWVSSRRYWKWDLTDVGLYTLAPQSVDVARGLPGEVEVAVFMKETEPTREQLKELLDLYREASEKVKVRFIDPDKNPQETKDYNVDLYNTIVFSRGEQRAQTTSHTEEDITSALIKVSRDESRTVCVVKGHGEKDLDSSEPQGFEMARKAIEGQGYQVRPISLLDEKAFDGCALVLLPGIIKRPMAPELERLSKYFEGGGRVFLLLDPAPADGLTDWLSTYGLEVRDDVVVDIAGQIIGANYLATVTQPPYPSHPVSEKLPGQMIFPAVRTMDNTGKIPEGYFVVPVVATRENVYAETTIEKEPEPEFNKGRDRAGPLNIAMAVIRGAKEEESAEETPSEEEKKEETAKKQDSRMLVVGDSDFANNQYLYAFGFNSDFLLNGVSWLADETSLVSIRPHKREAGQMEIPSQGAQMAIFFLPTLVGPALLVAAGVVVWLYRRRS
ncbi:MAG: Gldg family protein [Bdellovibrionota bacterium]